MQSLELRPSLRNCVLEALAVALALAAVLGTFMALRKGLERWPLIVATSLIVGLGVGVFYVVRFLRKSPRSVVFESGVLVVTERSGTMRTVEWATLRSATHKNDKGLAWTLEGPAGTFVLRDDGFSSRQWSELCARVRDECKAANVECSSSGIASIFDD